MALQSTTARLATLRVAQRVISTIQRTPFSTSSREQLLMAEDEALSRYAPTKKVVESIDSFGAVLLVATTAVAGLNLYAEAERKHPELNLPKILP